MLIICLLLIFFSEKKIDFNAWNVFWSGSTKNDYSELSSSFYFSISQQNLKNC